MTDASQLDRTVAESVGATGRVPAAVGRRSWLAQVWQPLAVRVGLVAFVLLLWWLLAASKSLAPTILASPGAVAKEVGSAGWGIVTASVETIEQAAIAIAISWVGGLLLGLVLGTFRAVRPLLGLARSAYAVPFVIVYPIMTVWFGYGSVSKVTFGAFAGIVPMILITASGVATVDQGIVRLFHSLGVSRVTLLRRAIFPAVLPGVLTALRLSGSLAFVSVVVGEMLVSTQGLGYWITRASGSYRTPALYLGICCVIILGVILHALIGGLQKLCASRRVLNVL